MLYAARSSSSRGSGTVVYLNVYDLVDNQYLFPLGLGAYHSGVQLGSLEYTYAGGSGVYTMDPRSAPGAVFRESIEMGKFQGTSAQLDAILMELRALFSPNDYHILKQNCNTFAEQFVWKLCTVRIPGYVNRMAALGQTFSCCIPPEYLDGQQTQTQSRQESTGGSSAGSVMQGGWSSSRPTPMSQVVAFSGTGRRLGGGPSSSTTTAGGVHKNPYREQLGAPQSGAMKPMNVA